MAKRLFTRVISAAISSLAGIATPTYTAVSYTAEEDMEIAGVRLEIMINQWTTLLAVAGVEGLRVTAELTQAALPGQPGSLDSLQCLSFISVQGAIAPNAVRVGEYIHNYVPLAIPVMIKEEGTLSILASHVNIGTANIPASVSATLYFARG